MRIASKILVSCGVLLGSLAPVAEAKSLTVTVTTTPNGGNYAPKNVVAIWVQNSGGTFVKTIGRWAATRKQHLVAWTAAAGAADADAVSGATRASHTAPLTLTWNLLDKANVEVPDGTYTIRMELADSNASTAGQNHQGTFTFVKGATSQSQTNLSNGGFVTVSLNYDSAVAAATCNNGVVDSGETCDPMISGSCPASCTASADACAPNVLVGAAATCTAACVVQTITACTDGDGCCAAGCDEASDSDCAAGGGAGGGGGANDADITGGCSTGTGQGGVLFGLGLLGLALARRRRS